jgi:hypothetical protein
MFEEARGVAHQHTTHYEVATHHPASVSRGVTPSSEKEAPSDAASCRAQDGVRSGIKRCPLWTVTTASHDEDCGWEAGSSGKVTSLPPCVAAGARQGCPQNTSRLLEEAYPNHDNPIRHKLKDYSVMWSFVASCDLT